MIVIVEEAEPGRLRPTSERSWHEFFRATAGSIADPEFRRHDQGEYIEDWQSP